MYLQIHAIAALVFGGATVGQPSAVLLEPLKCIGRIDYNFYEVKRTPFLRWSTVRMRRLENVDVHSDGIISFMVQYRDAGLIDCKARLTVERVASFREEVVKTRAWRLKGSKNVSPESETLQLRLERGRHCDLEFLPEKWATLPATRAVQAAIDRLKVDFCRGPCPEPRDRIPSYDRVEYPQ
jgi:hypothetical protein